MPGGGSDVEVSIWSAHYQMYFITWHKVFWLKSNTVSEDIATSKQTPRLARQFQQNEQNLHNSPEGSIAFFNG